VTVQVRPEPGLKSARPESDEPETNRKSYLARIWLRITVQTFKTLQLVPVPLKSGAHLPVRAADGALDNRCDVKRTFLDEKHSDSNTKYTQNRRCCSSPRVTAVDSSGQVLPLGGKVLPQGVRVVHFKRSTCHTLSGWGD